MQGLYTAAVQASVPLLVPTNKLVPANAIENMVFSFANIIAPIVGGIIFNELGLLPILIIAFIIYILAIAVDSVLKVPSTYQKFKGSISALIVSDLTKCFRFIRKKRPEILRSGILIFLFSIPSVGMLFVALPVLIVQHLGLGNNLYGLTQGVMMGGGLFGGILAGVFEKKISIQKAHITLLVASISIIILGIVFIINIPETFAYVIITISAAVIMLTVQLVIIQILAYEQLVAPKELVGKITSIVMALTFAAYPIGQFVFGALFEEIPNDPQYVLLIAAGISLVIVFMSRKNFTNIGI